jgi:hypothetical protein
MSFFPSYRVTPVRFCFCSAFAASQLRRDKPDSALRRDKPDFALRRDKPDFALRRDQPDSPGFRAMTEFSRVPRDESPIAACPDEARLCATRSGGRSLEPMTRIELVTSSLPRTRSAN